MRSGYKNINSRALNAKIASLNSHVAHASRGIRHGLGNVNLTFLCWELADVHGLVQHFNGQCQGRRQGHLTLFKILLEHGHCSLKQQQTTFESQNNRYIGSHFYWIVFTNIHNLNCPHYHTTLSYQNVFVRNFQNASNISKINLV